MENLDKNYPDGLQDRIKKKKRKKKSKNNLLDPLKKLEFKAIQFYRLRKTNF